MTSELAEVLIHHRLSPDVRAKQVDEEPLDTCDEALGVIQVVQLVWREDGRNIGAWVVPQEG